MNLKNIESLFTDNGCQKVYVKKLAPNDNSKNQVYFGGSFEILNILPISEIITEPAGDWEKERFKAKINFSWIDEDGKLYPAHQSQLILYPKYPEVRFSGFLQGCEKPPSELMTQRLADRLLFISVSENGTILGYVAAPNSIIANEFNQLNTTSELGVFRVIELFRTINSKEKLLAELKRIYLLDWIKSKRLDKEGKELPCIAPQCGGYTLEAELGITPNGYSEPDYLGWEIKQYGVTNFKHLNSKVITLMTPEPTHGIYASKGINNFVRQYGYEDLSGKIDRLNFGGIHKVGIRHARTKLKLELIGFDSEEGKIRNADGRIALIDTNENEAASWSFASMLKHWNKKHNQACYIPSLIEKLPERKYKYGSEVLLGIGTDFQLFLKAMAIGNIYYDPGIKMENASDEKPKIKPRSQFRIVSRNLKSLYKTSELIDVAKC